MLLIVHICCFCNVNKYSFYFSLFELKHEQNQHCYEIYRVNITGLGK